MTPTVQSTETEDRPLGLHGVSLAGIDDPEQYRPRLEWPYGSGECRGAEAPMMDVKIEAGAIVCTTGVPVGNIDPGGHHEPDLRS